jgi:signal transduction histidine kinase/FixJ family two-component response regulator
MRSETVSTTASDVANNASRRGAPEVLVVDDEPSVRGFIARVLTRNGFVCRTAANAEEAMTAASERAPSLTVCDLRMPGKDGKWLLQELKHKYPESSVIMLSAVADAKTAVACLKAGAEDYLVKPIDLDELLTAVRRTTKTPRLRPESAESRKDLETARAGTIGLQGSDGKRGRAGMNASDSIETILGQSCLFSSLSDDELHELGRLAATVPVSPDEVLFHEGEAGSSLFVVVSGTVRLSTTDENGRVQPTALLGAGQIFGEMAVLDGSPRSATAIATADARLARIENRDLDRLAAKFPDSRGRILREGLRLVSARLRKSNASFWELAQNAMREKRELTQSRASFLSLVSHELRTPLTVIKSSAQLVLRSSGEKNADLAAKIVAESDHLAILVDDLITLSLLRSGAVREQVSRFDAVELSERVVRRSNDAAHRRDVQLTLTPSMKSLWICGHASLIERAVHHLVDNAVKFSEPSTEVVVSIARDDDGHTCLSVADQGEGIPADRLTNLLGSFVQAQEPLNRHTEGLGIGLSLVDEIVRVHGGRLLVASTPGRGSKFTIALPFFNGDGADEDESPSTTEENDETTNQNTRSG